MTLCHCHAAAASFLAASIACAAALQDDWITQAKVRGPAQAPVNATTAEDAAGGCDGIKDGKWGFHTSPLNEPAWWQVDLGTPRTIKRLVVYNRCDMPERTAKMQILTSIDGQTWTSAYTHDGSVFRGFSDNKPLVLTFNGIHARFVRLQVPPHTYFHLDEVEVYGENDRDNLALHRPADQSSVSQWSRRHQPQEVPDWPVAQTIERGRALAADLRASGVDVGPMLHSLNEAEALARNATNAHQAYLHARAAVRKLVLANPIIDFDSILFVKRAPGVYSHISDQFYSWWARPGGGVYVLSRIKSDTPVAKCLTSQFPPGSFLSPDLSFDATRVLFSYCRFYPGRIELPNKVDKESQPEDAFYHVFEMNVDGTALRQITHGRYDDMFARYLPNGEIVFLSTRRGTALQCGKTSAMATLEKTLPDSYVRCGGDPHRPVAIYTLHTMDRNGHDLKAISAFESFEWDPSIASDGRILYARWDYVDRHNNPYMKLWSTNPDGTNPRIVWGNYTRNPQCTFEARSIPNSSKILMTATAHHSLTGGSLVLVDSASAIDGTDTLTRLTPEVCFPEMEGWPKTYYTNPWPMSEKYYLTAWSDKPILSEGNRNNANHLGLYFYDVFGNLELIHRDPEISSMYPIPIKPRPVPPVVPGAVNWNGRQEGTVVLQNVYAGLPTIAPGTIKRLRIVAMPPKVQPNMNQPVLGVTAEDPGKLVLGTVPVEADGSSCFRLPSGVAVFFQALDEKGHAVQTMRSLTYLQPGQTLACIGCHEPRDAAPPARKHPIALQRPPSKLKPGPNGSWPLRYDRLVQPVLDRHCVSCHQPGGQASKMDLTSPKSYDTLVNYGKPSLADHVRERWNAGRSVASAGAAQSSALLAYLNSETMQRTVKLEPDDYERLVTWIDTYGQRLGHFSSTQEKELDQFRKSVNELLDN